MSLLESFRLDGRRALVTGGGGALGLAMAGALAEAGATVAVMGRSQTVELAARAVREAGSIGFPVLADLADRDALVRGFGAALDELGGLDVLVTSHGTAPSAPALEYDVATWDGALETNLTSVFLLCQLAGRVMVPKGAGKIINVASLLSFSGGFRVAAYASSKGGIAQLTKALANEWAASGVNVNAIAPGYVRTALNEHVWRDDRRRREILARIPAGRWGEPDDFRGVVVFLASRASDYLHGSIVPVDGGWLAR